MSKVGKSSESTGKLSELSRVVCEVLYRFNKSKMTDLLSYPQFSYLLKKFLSIPNLLKFIGERSPQNYISRYVELFHFSCI